MIAVRRPQRSRSPPSQAPCPSVAVWTSPVTTLCTTPAASPLAHYQIIRRNGAVVGFEPGKIAWYAKVGSGAQAFPADKPGLTVVTQLMSSLDGLKKHNVDELRRITARR